MGKIIANFFIALDGVVESPHEWHFPYFDDAMGAAVGEGVAGAGAMLMGHQLYREWSTHWPQQPADEPFAAYINSVPKYVLAHESFDPEWQNTTVLSCDESGGEDVASQVQAIKDQYRQIAMSGSPTTVRWLLEEGLLDELNLLVHPIAVGHGARLFSDDGPSHPLRLVRNAAFPTGVLHLVYAPA